MRRQLSTLEECPATDLPKSKFEDNNLLGYALFTSTYQVVVH